ncbi:DUF2484 family protein [Frigidibacter sp. ROC022]|uniref:DUF2484 family protein n=1 Tax=Frigidibacter sp. ROC022 TaxID=2971796 RepID=UPI00215AAD78|nr:DUF2484 family protein [Frigidibacter sp. ROC022]MCR8725231.1 DUF2484 family protein [Frigidibacter sp. ROC022]
MSLPLILACVWAIAANLIGMLPSKDYHWRAAYLLIALGVPLVGWVTWTNGPWIGLIVLAAGASILRWPIWYLWRWMIGKGKGGAT